MEEHKINIPARLKNVSVGGHVAGVEDIIDDEQNKTQKQINKDVKDKLNTIDGDVLVEKERAEAAESNLSSRLSDVEARDALNIDGEGRTFATGDDFNNPDSIKRAKVATVGSIIDSTDDEPTAGSDNLVKSGAIYDVTLGALIRNDEMDEVLGGDVAVYLTDTDGNAVLDDEGKPIEII